MKRTVYVTDGSDVKKICKKEIVYVFNILNILFWFLASFGKLYNQQAIRKYVRALDYRYLVYSQGTYWNFLLLTGILLTYWNFPLFFFPFKISLLTKNSLLAFLEINERSKYCQTISNIGWFWYFKSPFIIVLFRLQTALNFQWRFPHIQFKSTENKLAFLICLSWTLK